MMWLPEPVPVGFARCRERKESVPESLETRVLLRHADEPGPNDEAPAFSKAPDLAGPAPDG